VLTAFGVVKFSQTQADTKQRPAPAAKVNQIKKLIEAAPVIPKPKVKKPAKDRLTKKTNGLLPVNRIFSTAKPGSQDWAYPAKSSASQSAFSLSSTVNLSHRIEFFGSFTATPNAKICYLVDCSGSMQGVFGLVRKKLKDSIASLQPDQYFYIIFFGGNRLFEFGNSCLVRATEQTKSSAYDFIDSVQPASQTNALAALKRAVQIRDSRGFRPSTIYFLTDGFELTGKNEQKFSQKIANLLAGFAPTTKINTIGFWPQSNDRKMLKTIAEQSGGEAVFITGY
jgi:hypothetical protein